MRKIIRDTLGRDLPVVVTEVNSSWAASTGGGDASLDSHYNAIWFADVLGRTIRQGTDFVAQFNIIGDFGLIDDPTVSIYAAKRAAGALTLMVINLGSQVTEIKLMLKNISSTNAET